MLNWLFFRMCVDICLLINNPIDAFLIHQEPKKATCFLQQYNKTNFQKFSVYSAKYVSYKSTIIKNFDSLKVLIIKTLIFTRKCIVFAFIL